MNSAAHGSEVAVSLAAIQLPTFDCDEVAEFFKPTCEFAAKQSPQPSAFLLETLGLPPQPEDEPTPLALYARILDAAPADAFIVDKSPAYSRVSDALRRAESFDPLYVWLVRHPLGVAASRIARRADLRKRSNDRLGSRLKYPAFLLRERLRRLRGAELRTLCEDWAGVHGRIREFLSEREPGRWLRLSYERLVRAPREHADELCRFLGVAFESAMLDPRGNVSAELRWGIGDESLLERERIDPAPADAWRRRYDAARVPASVARLAEQIGVEL